MTLRVDLYMTDCHQIDSDRFQDAPVKLILTRCNPLAPALIAATGMESGGARVKSTCIVIRASTPLLLLYHTTS